MKKIAQFSKVSKEVFIKAWEDQDYSDAESVFGEAYDNIILPKRATKSSASYDFFLPYPDGFSLPSGRSITIPTGIRCKIEEGYVLHILPKKGFARVQIDNNSIISSDFYYSDDEGHILIKLTNDSKIAGKYNFDEGSVFAQGIFLEYGITSDDEFEG